MPWQCQGCAIEVSDNVVCPQCGKSKGVWTIVTDETRNLVVTRKRMDLRKGTTTRALPIEDPAHESLALEPTSAISVHTKSGLRTLHSRGLLPASDEVLFVLLYTKTSRAELELELEVLYESQGSETLSFPQELAPDRNKDEPVVARFLFCHGEGDLEGVEFDGIPIVDIGEDQDRRFAPSVEISALGKPPQALPTHGDHDDFVLLFDPSAEASEDASAVEDDRFQLLSADGAYDMTLEYTEGTQRSDGLVELCFVDLIENTTYTLYHLPDPNPESTTRRVIFRGVPLDQLVPREGVEAEPLEERPEEEPEDEEPDEDGLEEAA